MYLDSFDAAILEVLSGEKRGKTLREVVGETGFARSTVIIHLRGLETKRLVRRGKMVRKGRGRPKYLYHTLKKPSPQWGLPLGVDDIIQVGFRRLRHACRYEKGGFCKRVRKRCAPTNCPLTK